MATTKKKPVRTKPLSRRSQASGKLPNARLLKRRKKTAAGPAGYFANPSASSTVRRAADLYERFTGHDAEEVGRVKVAALPKVAALIGDCDGVLYTTVRDGKTERYIHKFKAADRPLLAVSPDGKQLLLIGGHYKFTERGIVDATDRTG